MKQDAHPETIYLSACLAAGVFTPSHDGVEASDFTEHGDVFEYLVDYTRLTKHKAPSPELVMRMFPGFDYVPGVDMRYGKAQMRDYAKAERTNRQLHRAARLSQSGEHDQALSVMANSTKTVLRNLSTGGTSLRTWELNGHHTTHVPPPPGPLAYVTNGGQEPGMLWLVSARTTVGKSWRLVEHVLAALEGGWNVVFFSLEMTAEEVVERLHTVAFGADSRSMSPKTRTAAHRAWVSELEGELTIRGPEEGHCTPAAVAGSAAERTLIVVDHVGLMRDNQGTKAISEWTAMGAISNELKQIALAEHVPILAAVQANRASVSTRPGAIHGIDKLGLSDALGQDADLHISLNPYGPDVRLSYITKNRQGRANIKWYTAFEPAKGNFEVISADEASKRRQDADESEDAWDPEKEQVTSD